jgi:hypothetical protein
MLALFVPYQFVYGQVRASGSDVSNDRIECDPAKKFAKRGRVHISIDDATSLKFEFMLAVLEAQAAYLVVSISKPDMSAMSKVEYSCNSVEKLSSSKATP